MSTAVPTLNGFEIAVIGMAGRFPGAKTLDQFWQRLCAGKDALVFFTDQELLEAGVPLHTIQDPAYVKAGIILEDVDLFDAALFGITPREAEIMDPQHRLFLECAWEALEHAGCNPDTYPGAIGVYGGAHLSTYLLNNLQTRPDVLDAVGSYQTVLGNDKDFLTTRVAYKLNLRGPSINVNTACSTSLVAIHLAGQGLLSGACDVALAGGVAINVPEKVGYRYQEGGILSPDGRCRAFDAQAHGTIGGNGVGLVVLKRLEDALADGDCIHAIIKGSAINNDGAQKVGYTAPGVEGQARVIQAAQMMAEVEPETISYIETHGTGTELGDPIEIEALTQVFRGQTTQKGFCAIGSLKTNIGHLDAAAGVAGFIKTVLALEHKQVPPSLNFEKPNPRIDFANSPFYVNTRLTPWTPADFPCRAGVSSFGIGGANAHAILEEAPLVAPSGPARPAQLLLLSAQTSSALATATTNLAAHLKQHPTLPLADVAYTLQVGRRVLNHRRMVVCHDGADAVAALETMDRERVRTATPTSKDRPVAFMFSGQGAQYVNMGRELYEYEPVFREHLDVCIDLLQPHLGLDLRTVLYPETAEAVAAAADQLQQTWLTQPALFALEYALARQWMAWGIQPQALIGHSIGEYVAACLADVFSLEDALALVAERGQLIQKLPSGAMLSVSLPEEELQPLLGQMLSLAAVNAPARCVVSGPVEAVADLERRFAEKGINHRRLHTSHAFHSKMMEPILGLFTERLKRIQLRPPQIPYISNVTGGWITASEATDPGYWSRHLRQTVRFADGLQTLTANAKPVLLEVGPGATLTLLAKQQARPGAELVALASLRHPQDEQSDWAFLLNTLGQLWLAGLTVDWSNFYAHEQRRRLPLPTYPFERKRFWIEPGRPVEAPSAQVNGAASASQPELLPTPFHAPDLASLLVPLDEVEEGDPFVEQIITQQLEIITQQLALLAHHS